jgi:hypothetical protein
MQADALDTAPVASTSAVEAHTSDGLRHRHSEAGHVDISNNDDLALPAPKAAQSAGFDCHICKDTPVWPGQLPRYT